MNKSISLEQLTEAKVSRGTLFEQRVLPWLVPLLLCCRPHFK